MLIHDASAQPTSLSSQPPSEAVLQGSTESLCPFCRAKIPAQILIHQQQVWLRKTCPEHGASLCLLEADADYYLTRKQWDKPGTITAPQTQTQSGCPFDCGLCPEHLQHTCVGLIEITNRCNLQCPVCYADGQRQGNDFLDLPTIAAMLDFFQAAESDAAEILQLSGGEPTLHPNILDIIALARQKNIRYVMLNTNGVRCAEDREFVKALGQFVGGFEIYLQFDSFDPRVHQQFYGQDLTTVKQRAIEHLIAERIPITLVTKVQAGVNDGELGDIVRFGLNTPMVRGINFQPLAFLGRGGPADGVERTTLTSILRDIERQTRQIVKQSDFIPLPCDVERVAITYLSRQPGQPWIPLMRSVDFREHLPFIKNTLSFHADQMIQETIQGMATGNVCRCVKFLNDMQVVVPAGFHKRPKIKQIEFVNDCTFRMTVTSFLDAYNFEQHAMRKECVHVLTPDLRRIPFSAYNLFYRQQSHGNSPSQSTTSA
jgi:7,8-dihydro-6-hydroxymethylpterin dimethyltransferase